MVTGFPNLLGTILGVPVISCLKDIGVYRGLHGSPLI